MILLVSCQQVTVFHEYHCIENQEWHRTDTQTFVVPDSIERGRYQLSLELRYDQAYPYREAWLAIEDSARQRIDTLCIEMLDRSGSRTGRGLAGVLISTSESMPLYIHQQQRLKFKVYHLMRNEALPYIYNVGIRIEREK